MSHGAGSILWETDFWMGKEAELYRRPPRFASMLLPFFLKTFWSHGLYSQFSYSNSKHSRYYFQESPNNCLYPVECIECSCRGHQRRLGLEQVGLTLLLFLGHLGLDGCHLIREEKHINPQTPAITLGTTTGKCGPSQTTLR